MRAAVKDNFKSLSVLIQVLLMSIATQLGSVLDQNRTGC